MSKTRFVAAALNAVRQEHQRHTRVSWPFLKSYNHSPTLAHTHPLCTIPLSRHHLEPLSIVHVPSTSSLRGSPSRLDVSCHPDSSVLVEGPAPHARTIWARAMRVDAPILTRIHVWQCRWGIEVIAASNMPHRALHLPSVLHRRVGIDSFYASSWCRRRCSVRRIFQAASGVAWTRSWIPHIIVVAFKNLLGCDLWSIVEEGSVVHHQGKVLGYLLISQLASNCRVVPQRARVM
jgi:hypothetical protein